MFRFQNSQLEERRDGEQTSSMQYDAVNMETPLEQERLDSTPHLNRTQHLNSRPPLNKTPRLNSTPHLNRMPHVNSTPPSEQDAVPELDASRTGRRT